MNKRKGKVKIRFKYLNDVMEYKRELIEMKRKSYFGKIVKKVNEEFK